MSHKPVSRSIDLVYPFAHPSSIVGGTFVQSLQDEWEREDSRRIIRLNREADDRRKYKMERDRRLLGDGSDGRDVAAEVILDMAKKRRHR